MRYDRQIETTLPDEEDPSKPLMERAVKSKGTEVPFAEMDLDKVKEMTNEERDQLLEWIGDMAGELGKEMEDVWEKTEGKKERGNAKKGTGEGAFGSENLAQLVFNTVWGGQSTSESKRAPEAKDGTSGSRGEDMAESSKTGPLEPFDDMDIDEEEVTVVEKVKRGKGKGVTSL
ncbi:hypothetical protein ABKA04_006806 [Annulohypoxylon sp. FPYF3050]